MSHYEGFERWILSPTQLTLVLLAENKDHAMYLVEEALEQAGIAVLDQHETEQRVGTVISVFRVEKQIVMALSMPLTPHTIRDIANLVVIGLLLGFTVRGEINLGEKTITNIVNEE